MKKRSMFWSLSILLLVAFSCGMLFITPVEAGGAKEEEAKEEEAYVWKFAHEELPGGFMDAVAVEFKKRLAEKSGGKINVEIYPSGTLGTSEDLVELTQRGAIQFNWADAGHLGSLIPEVQALLLHYIFPKDMDLVKKVMEEGKFKDILDEKFRAKNLEPLGYFTEGWQIWTTNKLIRTPEDFKGLKMRTMTSKLIVDNYKAYGANPTPTPFSEVYSSLQLNMVEGQVNPAFIIYDMKFYEVQDYLTYAYSNPFILIMIVNKEFFDSLPQDIQQLVKETTIELIPFGFKWQEEFNQKNLDAMLEKKPGLNIIKLTQDEVDAFAELAKPVREVYFEMAGEDGPRLIEALEKDIMEAQK